jgi:phage shock protein E
MDWTFLAVAAAAVVVVFFLLKRASFVSADAAREQLQKGALVIDVRTPAEFRREHLPNAINLPLGDVEEGVTRQVKDKSQPLLVHCLSGGRSALAKRQLKKLGYTNVFNLGSYSRASQIVSGARNPGAHGQNGRP